MRCPNPRYVWPTGKIQAVPCGKCLACLSNKRQEWAFRLMQEYRRSKSAAFITLTYHPKFLPETGVSKRHFQLFMKRLRFRSGEKLRYYAVGEYGTHNGRAHYHAIIFNFQGDEKFLQSIWSLRREGVEVPLGIVHIGKVNEKSVQYTLKYVVQRGQHSDPKLNKPFALMSRSFGLGLWYLTDEMVAWHRSGLKNYVMLDNRKCRLPRYYKDKIFHREDIRKEVSKKAEQAGKDAEEENKRLIMLAGYSDPDKIIEEMRAAVYSRIKEKIAFTQKF